jgi:hypothetical protein
MQHPVFSVQLSASSVQHPASGKQQSSFRMEHSSCGILPCSIQRPASSTQHLASSIQHPASSAHRSASSIQDPASSFQHQASASGAQHPKCSTRQPSTISLITLEYYTKNYTCLGSCAKVILVPPRGYHCKWLAKERPKQAQIGCRTTVRA